MNTPPPITVESELLGCTSTPQAIGPLPLIQCAAPLASTAQVNIQAVPYLTPPQFLSPSQPYALHSPPLMGFPTAVSAHTTAAALSQPFWVTFATPRISRCQGCLGQIHHGTAPLDIALQHKEQIVFQNPNTGTWQLSRDLRNTIIMSHTSVWFQNTRTSTRHTI